MRDPKGDHNFDNHAYVEPYFTQPQTEPYNIVCYDPISRAYSLKAKGFLDPPKLNPKLKTLQNELFALR